MQAFYCHRCNKRISMEDIDEGRVTRYEGYLYCPECAEELRKEAEPIDISASVEVVSEVTPLPDGVIRCGRCQSIITPEQLASGDAVVAEDGRAYCPECTQLVMPLFEALRKQSTSETSEEQAPMVEPASDITSPLRVSPVYAPSPPQKSFTPFILLAAVVLIIVIILLAASGGGGTDTRGGTSTPPVTPGPGPEPPPPTPPPVDEGLLQNSRLLTERVEEIMSEWKKNKDHETALMRLEELKDMRVTSEARYSLLDAIRRVEEEKREEERRAEEEAKKAFEAVESDVKRLLRSGDFKGARKAIERFPERLRSVGGWWDKAAALEELIKRSEKAKENFDELKKKVEKLLEEKKLEEAKKAIVLLEADFKETPFEKEYKKLLEVVEGKIAEVEKKRREEEERRRKLLEAMRSQSPIFHTDFTKGKMEGTFKVVLKESGFPFTLPTSVVPSSPKAVRFLKRDGTSEVEFYFKLLTPPEAGLLTLRTVLPEPSPTTVWNTEVEVLLNGKSIEKRLLSHPSGGGGEFTAEFELKKEVFRRDENTLLIRSTGGNSRFYLLGVELRFALADADIKRLKEKVEKDKKEVAEENARFLKKYNETALRKWKAEIDRKGRRLSRKVGVDDWQSLFDGATLRYWRALDKNAEWKVENGEIVGVNNSDKWSVLEPLVKKMYNWLEYDLKFEMVLEGKGLGHFGFYVFYDLGRRNIYWRINVGIAREVADKSYIGKTFSCLVEARESTFTVYVGGVKQEPVAEIKERTPGYFIIRAGPHSTMRVKSVQIKLYKTK